MVNFIYFPDSNNLNNIYNGPIPQKYRPFLMFEDSGTKLKRYEKALIGKMIEHYSEASRNLFAKTRQPVQALNQRVEKFYQRKELEELLRKRRNWKNQLMKIGSETTNQP